MSTLGPKKKNLLIILAGIVVGALIISVVFDIMTNNGGRVILVGAIAGIVIAATVFLVLNLIEKKKSDVDVYDSEETRFTRRKNKDKNNDLFDAAGFEDELPQDGGSYDSFDDEASDSENSDEPFAVMPSRQLRENGFFGRKRQETADEPATEINEEEAWNEPEYADDFESGFDSGFENENESDEFAEMEFEAPVISFGNPVPAEEPAEEVYFDESAEFDSFEDATEVTSGEDDEILFEEPEYEVTADAEQLPEIENIEITEAEPETADTMPEAEPVKENNILLKDINPGMVVASQAPGQTLESFYADMSEEDIIYRDCVEVWSSAAKNPMLKILEKLKSIEDKKVAGELGRDCEYVNAMIDRMLYFTQLEMIDQALNMQVYNYSVLVKECLKRFSPFFTEKKISLLWKGLDVNVITDKRWFIFAMTQVIFNSIEFTPHGGKIAVSARKTDDYVDLIIDDSGEGVDAEELPYVFTAGFMGDEAPNPDDTRTGMGLFITRSVLQKLGGECMAESTKGKGMRIVIRLPAMKEEA